MQICLCGAQAGYAHDACCPYPLYRGSSEQVVAWEMKWAKNKQAAQQKREPDTPKSAPVCTCSMDDGIHEWNCALETARRLR